MGDKNLELQNPKWALSNTVGADTVIIWGTSVETKEEETRKKKGEKEKEVFNNYQ